ncbi:MAG: heavy metal translocating P-type ATPase [Bacilli bacterium]|jgi:Cd2+/Zn2+-exporting ATPase
MKKAIYQIEGLSCGNCAAKIERHLNKDDKIANASLDFAAGRLYVTYKQEPYDLNQVIEKINQVNDDDLTITHFKKNTADRKSVFTPSVISIIARLIISTTLLLIAAFAIPHDYYWLQVLIYSLSLLAIIYDITWKSIAKIIRLQNPLDENLLLTISAVGAFLMGLPILGANGQYIEGIMIIGFYQIGQIFEEIAIIKSRQAITKAVDLRGDTANLLVGEIIKTVHPSELKIGDSIVIKVGEIIPVDGLVINGSGTIDTSSLTGEFVPVLVEDQDHILSGSILKSGSLTLRVERLYEDSAISKILELVTSSGERKSKAEKFITKFARFYTPIVFVLAILVSLVPLVFPSEQFPVWIYNGLSVLVVSCPCAIVISVPLAFFSGIGLASKRGVIIKGTNYLDELSKIGYVLTDKTGTLTHGFFEVTKIVYNQIDEAVFWDYLIAAESQSNHPIAKAILHSKKIKNTAILQENYREIPGFGVSTAYQGKVILAGRSRFLIEAGIAVLNIDENGTIIHLAADGKYCGYVVLNDSAKKDAKNMVATLQKMQIETVLLSGDNEANARAIAEEVGIRDYHGSLTPEGKLEILESYLGRQGKRVGFMGDGVNDAPAIIRSDIGFAMSGIGSDIAVSNAEVIIVNDNPMKVVEAIRISKKTRRVAIFNIAFSLLVKFVIAVMIVLGVLGELQMTIAMLADTGLTVLMILNSLLLLYRKP